MIDCGRNNGRHPYTNFQCRHCRALIRAIVSYGEHVIWQHEQRCEQATPEERETWKRTKRWPRKVSSTQPGAQP